MTTTATTAGAGGGESGSIRVKHSSWTGPGATGQRLARRYDRFIDLEKAVADFGHVATDAAYVAVGLGVLGFQRAQVRRLELVKQLRELDEPIPGLLDGEALHHQLAELARALDEVSTPLRRAVRSALGST